MDGNKKIGTIVFACIIALALTACKVQQPAYIGLYVDNSISVNDTINPDERSLMMADTTTTRVVDTTVGLEAGLPFSLRPAEQLVRIASDTIYQYEINESPEAITDSSQLLRHQLTEVQNIHVFSPDTNFPVKIIHKGKSADSLLPEFELMQLTQIKNDTIASMQNQVAVLNNSAELKADTVYITKETVKLVKGDSTQADNETTQLLQTRNDTIAYLRKKVHDLQNSVILKSDTIYVFKETVIFPGAERQTDYTTLNLIKAKDEQIQMLQNQLNTKQAAAPTTPQQTQIIREPALPQLSGSQQTDDLALQMLQAKNDTILSLRSQLYFIQLQSRVKDTVIVGSIRNDTLAVKELFSEQETSDLFQAMQDTMQILKNMILSLEEQFRPGMDTVTLSSHDGIDVPSPAIQDTILLIAYYELGEVKPLEEESILKRIKELCSNNKVTKILLSGYTDSSGNELVNRKITDTRLNNLIERISQWIAREKVFSQNFGDAFASDTVVTEERKIEIRVHTE